MNVKPMNIVILAFALSTAATTAFGSDIIKEVMKLQRAGIDNDVILHFVKNSNSSADLDADDIQTLEDADVSSAVIIAMLDRSKELRDDPTRANVSEPQSPLLQPQAIPATYVESEVVAPAEGTADISLFYEALSPYGNWSRDNDNGWTWEPNDGVRDTTWRPYANSGHWTWTDSGWYWESTSPYGWATYHYGRWGYNSNHRWSWAPDNVWGPAWVDWRQSDDYIGWAPLPFGSRFEAGHGFNYRGRRSGYDFHEGMEERQFSFVASNAFLNVDLGVSFVSEDRRRHVYDQTKVINNTYVYNDNRVYNNGVSTTVIERSTNRKIQQVKVVDASIAVGQPIRGERRSNDTTIAVYRPKIAEKASVEPPAIAERRKVALERKETNKQAIVERKNDRVEAKNNSEAEKQSRARLNEEMAKRRQASSAIKKDVAEDKRSERKDDAAANRAAQEKVRAEQQDKRQDAAAERKDDAAANKAAQEKVRAEQQDKRQDAATERKDDAAAKKAAQDKVRAEQQDKQQDAVKERKDAAQAKKDEQSDARDEKKADAAKASAAAIEQRNSNQKAAEEMKAQAAATKESQAKARDEKKAEAPKQNTAAEEKRAANQEAAQERKAEAAAKQEGKREDREEAKEAREEKAREKKDNQK